MKKQVFCIILVLAVGLGLFPAEKSKPRFYLKFDGIGSIASGGDFQDFADRNETYFNSLAQYPDLYTISFTKKPFFRGFGGEIGVAVKSYAVGISFGYIEKNIHIEYHHADSTSGYKEDYTRDHTFSAIPIFLFIHYKLIDSRFLTAYFTIGEGVYLATYRDDRSITYEGYKNPKGLPITEAVSVIESKKNRLGFHVGATIDLNITANLALSLAAGYRLVSFKDMVAESYYKDNLEEDTGEGDFYYWINNKNESSQFTIGAPTNKANWDGEPAKLNMNGFSFSVGIKITLGSNKKSKTEKIAVPEEY